MGRNEKISIENDSVQERYSLAKERIETILAEQTVLAQFQDYFKQVATFILYVEGIREQLNNGRWETLTLDEMKAINYLLYEDVIEDNYEKSYGNPSFAEDKLGVTYGKILSFLYTEIRAEITYAFENRVSYMTICNELFIAIYNCFEDSSYPEEKTLLDIIYWYASDYCDVFLADRIDEQINPECSFATEIIEQMDLSDERFLYRYGEYISDNERITANHLKELPEDVIKKMADVYTEGYRIGFLNGGKDLSKKISVNIRFNLGFEKVIKHAIKNFEKMGLKPTIYRAAVSVITKRQQYKVGYIGAIANKQYEYDHRSDQGLFLDKKYVERKLDVIKNTYENHKELAAGFAGPAVMEVFGEKVFTPLQKKEAIKLDEKQEKLALHYDSKLSQLTNEYIKGEERSFTIIAYPIPEIGEEYKAIFNEVIKINTLDAKVYEQVQQIIIEALDKGTHVHIVGKGKNKTNLIVKLHQLQNPLKETIFENCVADVNIPVGEVFTTPVLEGTSGILYVSKVYLNELQYNELEITFENGKIVSYTCNDFETEEENQRYIKENILHNHESLPLGEFAIGTNTTAYVVARKYKIEDKMPILIAEKMGPHFAVGDTCYTWSEENKVFNPNGKEIVAKDNEISIQRKENVAKAYFQCHTDITIPYEELSEISVIAANGTKVKIIENERFVLPGSEVLNEPLENQWL